MNQSSKKDLRASRMASIRLSLANNPAIVATGVRLEEKMKNKLKRSMIDIEGSDLSDSQSSESDLGGDSGSLFSEKYQLMEKIGEGAHGVIHRCINKQTREECAVKTLALEKEHILHLRTNFIDIKGLKHPNILTYKALFLDEQQCKCHLVTDYLPYPNLAENQIKSEDQLKFICFKLLKTLEFLHSKKICHRDIKPENILYHPQTQTVKLVDFDLCRKLQKRGITRNLLTITGTPHYRAPEMFEGGGYDHMVDIWALGVTIFKLMTGFTPFESYYLIDSIHNIMSQDVSFPSKLKFPCSQAPKQLIKRLLKKPKDERLTAYQALKDVWFMNLWEGQQDEINKTMAHLNPSSVYQQDHPFILTLTHSPIKQREKPDSKTYFNVNSQIRLFEEPERSIFGLEKVQTLRGYQY